MLLFEYRLYSGKLNKSRNSFVHFLPQRPIQEGKFVLHACSLESKKTLKKLDYARSTHHCSCEVYAYNKMVGFELRLKKKM